MAGEGSLQGRVALVTGVSRSIGIGYAVADRTKSVYLPQQRLIGTGKRFRPE